MRIHEGNYAYDIELQRDPNTQLPVSWRFDVYRVRPVDTRVGRGEAGTREEAESRALKMIREFEKSDPGRAA